MAIVKPLHLFMLVALCWGSTLGNYRTCMCDIRLHPYANAKVVINSSHRLRSKDIFDHISCDDVKHWCHKTTGKCHNWGNDQLKPTSTASLDSMCKRYGGTNTAGIEMYSYSKVMNNCGGTWDSHKLNKKLCCMKLPAPTYRTIGWVC